jgi:hypothetical protein
VGQRKIRRGSGQHQISGKDFRLADEIRYIQRRAAAYDGRFVTVDPLALFSTDSGDAWLLDPAHHLAAQWRGVAIPSRSTLRKLKQTSQLNGREPTLLTAMHLCTSTTIPLASSPSSAIQPPASRNWADQNFKYVWLVSRPRNK